MVGVLAVVRLLLCRRAEPLPRSRIDGLVRAAVVLAAIVLITAASDWASVLAGAHLADWDWVTAFELVVLAVMTIASALAAIRLIRAVRGLPPAGAAAGPDCLADGLTLAHRGTRHLGRLAPATGACLGWIDGGPSLAVRRHPVGAAALVSGAGALAVTAAMAREEGLGPVPLLFFSVMTCGLFAFLVATGAYLRIVRPERPPAGRHRMLLDGLVLAAAMVPVTLAFRDHLWWVMATNEASSDVWTLGILLGIVAAITFVVVVALESVLRIHPDRG